MHTQPATGATPTQPVDVVGAGAGAGAEGAAGAIPGGSQPPFTQTQSEPGWMVVQPVVVGGGGGATMLAAGSGAGCDGGSQPPFTHTQS